MGSQAVLAPSEFRFLQPLERRVEKLHGGGDAGKTNMGDGLLSSPPCAMQRQVSVAAGGSLDQVWRDIHRPNFQTTQAAAVEDFLAQTGVGQREEEEEEEEENGLNRGNNGSLTIFAMDSVLAGQNLQHPEWLQFHNQHQQFGELSAQANSNNDIPLMAASSGSEHPVWKKRGCESIADHTVERRQKRMIKNRESAARSRARRQVWDSIFLNLDTILIISFKFTSYAFRLGYLIKQQLVQGIPRKFLHLYWGSITLFFWV